MKNSFPYPGLVLGGMMNRLLAWREVVDKVVKTSFQTFLHVFPRLLWMFYRKLMLCVIIISQCRSRREQNLCGYVRRKC